MKNIACPSRRQLLQRCGSRLPVVDANASACCRSDQDFGMSLTGPNAGDGRNSTLTKFRSTRLGSPMRTLAGCSRRGLLLKSERRKRGMIIITAGKAGGPNGLVRKNHRHLTNLDEANLSSCAVNGGFKFPQREADMRMEAVCREGLDRRATGDATGNPRFSGDRRFPRSAHSIRYFP